MKYIMLLVFTLSGYASAHQWTPTYPELRPSFVPKVYTTQMTLFNAREDVKYYQIEVLDANMEPMDFATPRRIIEVEHTKKVKVDIYIREQDKDKAVYICSKSKLLAGKNTATVVSSRICSKLK